MIGIYAHRFCGGNQKRILDEIIERYNLDYLIEESANRSDFNNNFNNDGNCCDRNKNGNMQFFTINKTTETDIKMLMIINMMK